MLGSEGAVGRGVWGYVRLSLRLPSSSARSVAVQGEHLQKKCWSWPHLAQRTKRDLVLRQHLFIKHLLSAALAGSCATWRRLGGGTGGVHSWARTCLFQNG